MFNNYKLIYSHNHTRISSLYIYTLFLEKNNNHLIHLTAKILRKYIFNPFLCLSIGPESFEKKNLLSLRLPHPYMIIIHPKAKIGPDCTIYHEVTIGCRENISQNAPFIQDSVYIGCKSALLGNILIGTKTTIGAGSLIFASTPPIAKFLDYTNKNHTIFNENTYCFSRCFSEE